jgi:hypothetical protein
MQIREYLILTTEGVAGTFDVSTTPAPTVLAIPLDGSNAFQGVPKPATWTVRGAYSGNKRFLRGTEKMEVDLKLKTHLYVAHAPTMLGWAFTEIGSAQTTPWTTTEPIGDLASVTLDHALMRSDGSWETRRFLGCKAASTSISASGEGQIVDLEIDIKGQVVQGNQYDSSVNPTLTPPALSSYPTDIYTFQGTKGAFTLGSVRTNYQDLKVDIKSTLFAPFDESNFVNRIRYRGRDASISAKLLVKASPDDRTTYEKQLAQTGSIVFNNAAKNHTATFTFNAQNFIDDLPHDLPLDKDFYWNMKIENFLDATAGEDFTVAFT